MRYRLAKTMATKEETAMDRKNSTAALRIHISCSSSVDSTRSSAKGISKGNHGSAALTNDPSPILATNFHTVHPSAKYHPLARYAKKPLSTYTTLGTPIPRMVKGRRQRSMSLGSSSPHSHNSSLGSHQHAEPILELPSPPWITARRQAVEEERARAAEMEKEEEHCNAEELRMILKKERLRMESIQGDLTELKSGVVQEQLQAEVLEEECINGMVRRLDQLHEEKARIMIEEREQEMVCNETWLPPIRP